MIIVRGAYHRPRFTDWQTRVPLNFVQFRSSDRSTKHNDFLATRTYPTFGILAEPSIEEYATQRSSRRLSLGSQRLHVLKDNRVIENTIQLRVSYSAYQRCKKTWL